MLTEEGLAAIDIAERFADGKATRDEIRGAAPKAPGWSRAFGANPSAGSAVGFAVDLQDWIYGDPNKKEVGLVGCLYTFGHSALATDDVPAEWRAQCDLIRDIFGNPFRSVSADPQWLTSTVVALAEGIYNDRAFDRMTILADALQDAGCDNEDILNHCRQPGEHVRGCWVIDLLTGRK